MIYKKAAKNRSDWTLIFLAKLLLNQLTVTLHSARLRSRLVTVDVCGPPVKLNKVSVTGLAGSADSCVPYHWSGLCVQASTEVRPRACRTAVQASPGF